MPKLGLGFLVGIGAGLSGLWFLAVPVQAQTPTPALTINLYSDPLDGSVQLIGGMCQRYGLTPTPQPIAAASASAYSATRDQTYPATQISDDIRVVVNHDDSVSDYRVRLLLPTPAPGHTGPLYACSCPYVNGQDYTCEYAGIGPNDSVNVFVTDLNASEAWWQVVGGQVFAQYKLRSKIPVEACTTGGTCIPSLLVAPNGTDSVGFAAVGAAGAIETDRNGSSAYVHRLGDRTTAMNGQSLGFAAQQIDFTYYYQTLSAHMVSFTTLSQLQTLIAAQLPDTSELYYYAGTSTFILDQTDSNPVLTIADGKRVSVFVPTNLEFRHTAGLAVPALTSVTADSFLGFFVAGNVTIAAEVGYSDYTVDRLTAAPNLSAMVLADGQIIVAGDGDSAVTDRILIAEGSFIAWDKSGVGNGIVLRRTLDNASDGLALNSQYPAEVFRFRPGFTANFPEVLEVTDRYWQEIAPQKVE